MIQSAHPFGRPRVGPVRHHRERDARPRPASEGYLAFKKNSPEAAAAAEKSIPLQRMGDPEEDLGGVALFLTSDDGQYITGHTIFADGGGHMGSAWHPPRSTTPDGTGHFVP